MAICEHCNYVGHSKGDGKCSECHGTGWRCDVSVVFDTFSPKESQKCRKCNGSGVCPYCGGKGYVKDPIFWPNGILGSNESKRESSSRRERQEHKQHELEYEYSSGSTTDVESWKEKNIPGYKERRDRSLKIDLLIIGIVYLIPAISLMIFIPEGGMKEGRVVFGIFWPIIFLVCLVFGSLKSLFGSWDPADLQVIWSVVGGLVVAAGIGYWLFQQK